MPRSVVRLQQVRVGELPELARHALQDRARYGIVPISVQRAQAQAHNPAASSDDVGLIVAYLEDRCVGYLGLVPVWLEEGHRRRKILSLSTYFVGEDYRGTGAGTLLLLRALTLGHALFVVGLSKVADRVCQGLGFRPAGPVVVLNLRIDAALVLPILLGRLRHRLGNRAPGFVARALDGVRRLSRRTLEAALRPLVIRLLVRPLRIGPGELVCCAVENTRTPEGLRHDGALPGGSRFVRDEATVNWMIHNPWITEDQNVQLDYVFSYRRELFRFFPFELREAASGRNVGYVVLRISTEAGETVLRILDCVLVEERHRGHVLHLALREALRWSANRIECGEEFELLLRSSLFHRVLARRETRTCLLFTGDPSASSNDPTRELRVGICDGDAPFV